LRSFSLSEHTNNTTVSTKSPIDRRLFIGSATALTLLGLFSPRAVTLAFAAPTSAEKQAEADEVAAKLAEWKMQLDEALRNYYAAIDAHDAAIAKMSEAQARIDAAEAREADLQQKLGVRAKNQYKQGPTSFFEVLFGARSFTEFASSWDLVNQVNADNARMIAECKAAKTEAEDARDEYLAQEQIAAQKLAESEEIKAEAEAIVVAYESELVALEEEVRELVRQEEAAEEARKAEEARRAAEAAAAANGGFGGEYSGSGITNYPPGTFASIVAAAQSQLGVPYVWGGSTAGVGLDCSGLTQWCYRQVGISIPRVDTGQYSAAPNKLPVSEAQPGDILWRYGHVAICTSYGGGEYIHAPSPGNVVCYATRAQFSHALRW
jgi:cell wall-associated NlpC family hydrolase